MVNVTEPTLITVTSPVALTETELSCDIVPSDQDVVDIHETLRPTRVRTEKRFRQGDAAFAELTGQRQVPPVPSQLSLVSIDNCTDLALLKHF